jgi:hypothetical protein
LFCPGAPSHRPRSVCPTFSWRSAEIQRKRRIRPVGVLRAVHHTRARQPRQSRAKT